MSDNYRYYVEKVRAARSSRQGAGPLREALEELFATVRHCERIWAIEQRIDRELGYR